MRIDGHLLRAWDAADGWSGAAAVEAAGGLGGSRSNTVIDWDEGAGESWVRLVAGDDVIAYVCTQLPLAIVEGHSAETSGLDPAMQSIVVSSMSGPELSKSQTVGCRNTTSRPWKTS